MTPLPTMVPASKVAVKTIGAVGCPVLSAVRVQVNVTSLPVIVPVTGPSACGPLQVPVMAAFFWMSVQVGVTGWVTAQVPVRSAAKAEAMGVTRNTDMAKPREARMQSPCYFTPPLQRRLFGQHQRLVLIVADCVQRRRRQRAGGAAAGRLFHGGGEFAMQGHGLAVLRPVRHIIEN